jgi:hypothetical protein
MTCENESTDTKRRRRKESNRENKMKAEKNSGKEGDLPRRAVDRSVGW